MKEDKYFERKRSIDGLSRNEVLAREKAGAINNTKSSTSKSYLRIIKDNIFTFFTMALFLIAFTFLMWNIAITHGWLPTSWNLTNDDKIGITKFIFLIPLVINIIIGIIQEIKSKRTLDKLKIVNDSKYQVFRNHMWIYIPSKSIVLDDTIKFTAGDQIPADAIVLSGNAEVNESLLTGESDTVKKKKNDELLSGSIIVSGSVVCAISAVGTDTYVNRLQTKLKKITKTKSELMKNIYGLIKILSVVLVIMLIIVVPVLIYKHNKWPEVTIKEIVQTSGAVAVGVIPTGLILLTSVTLAVSVIKLAKNKTLVQEMFSLENLSRIDTICLDKTGTLTDGSMSVDEVILINKIKDFDGVMGTFLHALPDGNQTSIALSKRFHPINKYEISGVSAFSSARKSSSVTFKDGREFILGAPEYILKNTDKEYLSACRFKAAAGYRVLAFTEDGVLIAIICLKDNIRKSAPSTIKYFNENGVDVKIISGDNPVTVSKIAQDCGVKNFNKIISMENVTIDQIPDIVESFTIFGRVTPEQKEAIVTALQAKGKKVAMTGDGVNDILALKKANASISFSNATDAAKKSSDVVLLDNDFGHLKEVVGQGRRVVNNIQRTSILFLMKTIFIILLTLTTIPTKKAITILNMENLYLIETCIVAIGGFLLSMENSNKPITSTFKKNVYPKALISGTLLAIAGIIPIIVSIIANTGVNETLFTLLITVAGLIVYFNQCIPLKLYRVICIIITFGLVILLSCAIPDLFYDAKNLNPDLMDDKGIIGIILNKGLFNITNSVLAEQTWWTWLIVAGFIVIAMPLYTLSIRGINKLIERSHNKFMKKILE